jgi:GTP pyrophosphokinase
MILSNRFSEALTYAAQLHATQVRKGSGVPYIAHLLGTASIALEYGANEDEAISALLHDAIEDQGGHATRSRHPPPLWGYRHSDCRRLYRQ